MLVAINTTFRNACVAKRETDNEFPFSYTIAMLSQWLQRALEGSKTSQAALSRELTDRLGRSIDRAAVNKMVKGTRAIAADELNVVEIVTGWEAPSEIEVPLVGEVGAGGMVIASERGSDDTVPAPRDTRPGTVAVRIKGDSMFPAYEDGELLYYSRHLPPSDLLNRRAVVQLADGRIVVKVIRSGSQRDVWTLQSINPNYADMPDEVVLWAAPIDWIKPR